MVGLEILTEEFALVTVFIAYEKGRLEGRCVPIWKVFTIQPEVEYLRHHSQSTLGLREPCIHSLEGWKSKTKMIYVARWQNHGWPIHWKRHITVTVLSMWPSPLFLERFSHLAQWLSHTTRCSAICDHIPCWKFVFPFQVPRCTLLCKCWEA